MMESLSLHFAPLLPWPWLAGLGMAAVAAALPGLLRRAPGSVLRLMALALVLLVLAGPRGTVAEREPVDDVAVVAIDKSPSQEIGDRPAQTRRAARHLRKALGGMEHLTVRTVRTPAEGPRGEGGTHLFRALERATADIPRARLAGVFLVTDGQVHDVPDRARACCGEAPVHALITGAPGAVDRRLAVTGAPAYAIVGSSVTVRVRLTVKPAPAARDAVPATVRLDGERVMRTRLVPGRERAVRVPVDRPGRHVVTVEAAVREGEVSAANNRAALTLNGVRDRLKVLLISGKPHPGERAWRRLLKGDPAVDLVHFTILRSPAKRDPTPTEELALIPFPVRELFNEKLPGFDLVIFDRYRLQGVLRLANMKNVADYVRDGGALLAAVGAGYGGDNSLYRSPLGDVLPAPPEGGTVTTPFRPKRTETGRRHPVTAGLPRGGGADAPPRWGPWFRLAGARAADGRVLMTGPGGRPLLVLGRMGDGRVASLLSGQMWLWARGYAGGGPHARLNRRLFHWLMKEPDLAAEALRARVRDGRLHVTRRSLDKLPEAVTVTGPRGDERRLSLAPAGSGRAEGSLPVTAPGLYTVTDGERTARAPAGGRNPPERMDARATADKLAPLVQASGGGTARVAEGLPAVRRTGPRPVNAGPGWLGVPEGRAARVTGVRSTPLPPAGVALALLLGALMLAWWREGR